MSETPMTDKLACTPVMPTTEKGYLAALRSWATLSRQIETELAAKTAECERLREDADRYREARRDPAGFVHILNLMVRDNASGEALDKMMDRIKDSRANAAARKETP